MTATDQRSVRLERLTPSVWGVLAVVVLVAAQVLERRRRSERDLASDRE